MRIDEREVDATADLRRAFADRDARQQPISVETFRHYVWHALPRRIGSVVEEPVRNVDSVNLAAFESRAVKRVQQHARPPAAGDTDLDEFPGLRLDDETREKRRIGVGDTGYCPRGLLRPELTNERRAYRIDVTVRKLLERLHRDQPVCASESDGL